MRLEPALFPERVWVGPPERAAAEETVLGGTAVARRRSGTVGALEHWVRGGSFHQYGRPVLVQLTGAFGVEEAVRRIHEYPARLDMRGEIGEDGWGSVRWLVSYQRAGDPDANGFHSGASFLEDACYSALTMIEEHEREAYEQALIVGTA